MHALEVIMIFQTTLEAESCHVLELIDFFYFIYILYSLNFRISRPWPS